MSFLSATPPSVQTRDDYSDHVSHELDFEDLADWAQLSLASAEVPCTCLDAQCLRCRVERIVAQVRRGA